MIQIPSSSRNLRAAQIVRTPGDLEGGDLLWDRRSNLTITSQTSVQKTITATRLRSFSRLST
ncbi:MAG TPA: hypothetical protein VKA15_23310, partial [Isosphaeraceae bacterium]|nr:hypothetical protein [Isosphaeraceae bacterium]